MLLNFITIIVEMNLLMSLFTATLFVLLVPGILFKIPAKGNPLLIAAVHGLLFALIYDVTHKLMYAVSEGYIDKKILDCVTIKDDLYSHADEEYGYVFTIRPGSILPDGVTFYKGTFFTKGTILPTVDIRPFADSDSITEPILAGTPFPESGVALSNDLTVTRGFTTTTPIYTPPYDCFLSTIQKSQRYIRTYLSLRKYEILPKGTTFAGTTTGKGHILPFDLPYIDVNGTTGTIPKDTRFTQMLTSTADISLPQDAILVQAIIYPTGYDETSLEELYKNIIRRWTNEEYANRPPPYNAGVDS